MSLKGKEYKVPAQVSTRRGRRRGIVRYTAQTVRRAGSGVPLHRLHGLELARDGAVAGQQHQPPPAVHSDDRVSVVCSPSFAQTVGLVRFGPRPPLHPAGGGPCTCTQAIHRRSSWAPPSLCDRALAPRSSTTTFRPSAARSRNLRDLLPDKKGFNSGYISLYLCS